MRIPNQTSPRIARGVFFALTMLAIAILGLLKVRASIATGPDWDTYAFLGNAADFAGKGFGYTEAHRPPLISLLTSLFFRFGDLEIAVIQWIDGALSLSGFAAFYLLLRQRFDLLLSAGGTLMLFAAQPLWAYLGVGYTDFPAIAISLWLLLTLIRATEHHPAWYLLAGPLFTAAVMMRYTSLLFAFPLLVWALFRWRPFPQAKWILGGIGTAVAAYLPAASHYLEKFGDPLFPFIVALAFSETVSAPGGEGQVEATGSWYLEQLPYFLAPERLRIIALLALLLGALGLLRLVGEHISKWKAAVPNVVRILTGMAIAIAGQVHGGLFARQISIPIAVIVLWSALAPREKYEEESRSRISANNALDAAMLTAFLTYLDFHGHQPLQVPRYFIAMAPSLIYFMLLGWREWGRELNQLRATLKTETTHNAKDASVVVAAVFVGISLLLAVGTAALTPIDINPSYASGEAVVSTLLKDDPAAQDATMLSDLWPLTSWQLKSSVAAMPFFEDAEAFEHELEKTAADYFITFRDLEYAGYSTIHESGGVQVRAHQSTQDTHLPSVQYLGKSWDNYLESVTEYDFYLMSTAGRYGWEGSAFIDALSPETLASYDAVAAYGWKWRDRNEGEVALAEFVSDGGSLVIDASQNLDGLAYSVAGTIMFYTFVVPERAPQNATLRLEGEFAKAHPELTTIDSAPFVDETGAPWTGATYLARPGTEPLETLVTLNGAPAVQVRRIGSGSVYFIAYNLVWHAFSTENADESALIGAIFDDAIKRADGQGE